VMPERPVMRKPIAMPTSKSRRAVPARTTAKPAAAPMARASGDDGVWQEF
jgi:hypothetical protein